ncbi:ComF family protein [Sphingomonas koreensis]|jgi:ComF family protein|uniref:Amidophosphoribosyltransferase n=1 Tax=Sphingomonas koreensis TaxID=93064 RepID=A0A1L6JE02_9SPHN|nr:ComF family protein [Sphingomonas koreensis]APR54161.1 amidophosphoribosyltransferase [Sphingomonas koreensis]MDC7809149.1 ComF family protein [Sphingomonas koreensis]RSU18798.1 ComF family protein [Sphingomonas koreensis]RSU25575.1 ComF family protein [Sphingomonas koreensis]RSU25691.1 ComF family protein [Sphingomonas koreensis]
MGVAEPVRKLVALALPPRCPGCGEVVDADHRFCAACWSGLTLIAPPWCATCNLPFDYDRGPDAQCGRCLAAPPRHDGVRAAVAYGPTARTLALRLKYGGRTAYAATAARLMARLMPEGAELLVPVPLHRGRIWRRGFNQAALIARELSRRSDVPVELDLLRRVKATPVLRGLGARGRNKAVAGAFAAGAGARETLKGKAVVLVDDVHTSGATADACVRVLKRAGAAKVTILCWARVLDPDAED